MQVGIRCAEESREKTRLIRSADVRNIRTSAKCAVQCYRVVFHKGYIKAVVSPKLDICACCARHHGLNMPRKSNCFV
jgi:hypothetical protein